MNTSSITLYLGIDFHRSRILELDINDIDLCLLSLSVRTKSSILLMCLESRLLCH